MSETRGSGDSSDATHADLEPIHAEPGATHAEPGATHPEPGATPAELEPIRVELEAIRASAGLDRAGRWEETWWDFAFPWRNRISSRDGRRIVEILERFGAPEEEPPETADESNAERDRRRALRARNRERAHLRSELRWQIIAQGIDHKLIRRLRRPDRRAYKAAMADGFPVLRRAGDMAPVAHYFGPVPAAIQWAEKDPDGDLIAQHSVKLIADAPGHDDIHVVDGSFVAYMGSIDGSIEQLDFTEALDGPEALDGLEALDGPGERPLTLRDVHQTRLLNTNQMPAGMAAGPPPQGPDDGGRHVVYFCACRRSGRVYPGDEAAGIYYFDPETGDSAPFLTRVPRAIEELPPPEESTIQHRPEVGDRHPNKLEKVAIDDLDLSNSRPLSYPNDLAVSAGGRFLFVTESSPFTSMGFESVPEVIQMAGNGRIWGIDRVAREVFLVARGQAFPDGILIDAEATAEEETAGELPPSLLVSELTRFRILRLNLRGERAGETDVLWRDLPGMPDGMDRDPHGNIWVALFKKRSMLMNVAHRFPRLKKLLLRFPQQALTRSMATGLLVLNRSANDAIWYAMHRKSRRIRGANRTGHIASISWTPKGVFLNSFWDGDPRKNIEPGIDWLPAEKVREIMKSNTKRSWWKARIAAARMVLSSIVLITLVWIATGYLFFGLWRAITPTTLPPRGWQWAFLVVGLAVVYKFMNPNRTSERSPGRAR